MSTDLETIKRKLAENIGLCSKNRSVSAYSLTSTRTLCERVLSHALLARQNKEYLLKTYGVEEIGVFGSFARGDHNENSDIDISVELNHEKVPVGLFEFARMQFYLEDLLGKKLI